MIGEWYVALLDLPELFRIGDQTVVLPSSHPGNNVTGTESWMSGVDHPPHAKPFNRLHRSRNCSISARIAHPTLQPAASAANQKSPSGQAPQKNEKGNEGSSLIQV
jgi:hypothetical protein